MYLEYYARSVMKQKKNNFQNKYTYMFMYRLYTRQIKRNLNILWIMDTNCSNYVFNYVMRFQSCLFRFLFYYLLNN